MFPSVTNEELYRQIRMIQAVTGCIRKGLLDIHSSMFSFLIVFHVRMNLRSDRLCFNLLQNISKNL